MSMKTISITNAYVMHTIAIHFI